MPMSSPISDQALGEAILQAVQHGAFPQSEDVASAPVPAEALPKLLEAIKKAQDDIKVGFRSEFAVHN
jgi:centromere/kinetochore protein ZW10